jgi:hypothetical protein
LQEVPVSDAEAIGSLQGQAGLSEVRQLLGLVLPSTQLSDSAQNKLISYKCRKIKPLQARTVEHRVVLLQKKLSANRP